MPTPLSAARRNANRQNAQKSTGPRTARGKARSCQNARKHGLTCADPMSLLTPAERARWRRRKARWAQTLQPFDATERALVDQAALACTLLEHAHAVELAALAEAQHEALVAFDAAWPEHGSPLRDKLRLEARAAAWMPSDLSTALARFLTRRNARLHRSLNQLRRLQNRRRRAAAGSRVGGSRVSTTAPKTNSKRATTRPYCGTNPRLNRRNLLIIKRFG